MTLKRLSILLILLTTGYGQHSLSLLPFEGTEVSSALRQAGYNKLETALIESGRFQVIEKEKRDQVLQEQKDQWSGCFEDSCIVELGKLLGANYLITGNIIGLENFFQINIKIIDIEKGVVTEKVTKETLGTELDLLRGVEDASHMIIQKIDSTYVIPARTELQKIVYTIQQIGKKDSIKTVIVEKPVYVDRIVEKDNYRYHRNAIGFSTSWGQPGQWNWGLRFNHYPLMLEYSQGLMGSGSYHEYAWTELENQEFKSFLGDSDYSSETYISGREISIGYGWWQFISSGASINLIVGQTEFIGNDEYGGLYENEDNVWEYVGANVKIYRNLYYVALGYVVGDGNLFDEHQFYMQLGFHFTLGFGHVN